MPLLNHHPLLNLIRKNLLAAVLLMTVFAMSHAEPISGQGTWETTLQARYLSADQSKGPDAFYDSSLNVTWLANAGFDYGTSGWQELLGLDSQWRLPTINGTPVGCSLPEISSCSVSFDVNSSEIAHMYYVTLGNKAGVYDSHYNLMPGTGMTNTGPFSNLMAGMYYVDGSGSGISSPIIWMNQSGEAIIPLNSHWGPTQLIWAVHPGDVGFPAALPEPESKALLLIGLISIGLVARRQKKHLV